MVAAARFGSASPARNKSALASTKAREIPNRELAESANVSVPTAMKALRLLEAKGLLARGGPGSRYQRLTPAGGGPEPTHAACCSFARHSRMPRTDRPT